MNRFHSRTVIMLIPAVFILAVIGVSLTTAQTISPYGFVLAEIDNPNPYLGQPLTYTFRFYDSQVAQDIRFIPPNFEGFGQQQGEVVQTIEVVDGIQYRVFTQETILFPLRSGKTIIDPALIEVPENPFQTGETLSAQTIELDIQPLPAEGVPDSFNGAVGQFDMSASVDITSARSGDPIVLVVSVTGTGNLEQVVGPQFYLPDGWRSYPEQPVYSPNASIPLLGTMKYEWMLVTDIPGDYQLFAEFSFFDPQERVYKTLSAELPAIQMEGESRADDSPGPEAITGKESLTIRSIQGGSSPLGIVPGTLFWILWLVPPVVVSGVGGIIYYRKRKSQSQSRPITALRRANMLLRTVQKTDDAVRAYKMISDAVNGYFSSKLGMPVGEVTEDVINTVLASLSEDVRQKTQYCLEQIQIGRYAPMDTLAASTLARNAYDVLKLLDREWDSVEKEDHAGVR